MRTEFGVPRSECGCEGCRTNCMFMPGFLIPSDLQRMIPNHVEPLAWAETNLLASPGALVQRDGERFRIPTLVPAVKPDGSCIHLNGCGACSIHAVSPFGCAFFSCTQDVPNMSAAGLWSIYTAPPEHLYHRLWRHLDNFGKRQERAEVLRARMCDFMLRKEA